MRRYPRHRYPRHRYPVRRYAYRRARRSWARALGLVLVGICLACGAWALLEGVIWPEEGDRVSSDGSLTMDYSHASQGYVLARASSSKRLKLRVSKGDTTLTYDLNGEGEYEVFPLQLGDGKYSWTLYENVTGNSYAQAGGMSFSVELEDVNAPFLCPNQYVNFTPESQVVAVAAELCQGLETGAEKLAAVRAYIQENYLYDYIKAVTTTPEWHFSSRMAKLSSGVGRSVSNRKTVNPFEAKMSATCSANMRELLRLSRPIATRICSPAKFLRR